MKKVKTTETFAFWLPNLFYCFFIWNSFCFWMFNLRDDTHMTSIKIVYFSRLPTPLSIYIQSFSTPLNLGRPTVNETLPTLSGKLWNNNRTVYVNDRNQNKNKTKSRHIQIDRSLLFNLDYKQCNAIIKVWVHTRVNRKISCQ